MCIIAKEEEEEEKEEEVIINDNDTHINVQTWNHVRHELIMQWLLARRPSALATRQPRTPWCYWLASIWQKASLVLIFLPHFKRKIVPCL